MKSICVYCGSSNNVDAVFKDAAIQMGKAIAKNGYRLVYGGGKVGLMGLVADAAISQGGQVLGFIPQQLDEYEGAHVGIQELHIVDTMHTRKQRMEENSDAFVVLPGGFGTLDELFEIMTWRQLGIHNKPIFLVNINHYWYPLTNLISQVVQNRFAKPEDLGLVTVVNSIDDVFKYLPKAAA